MYPWFPLAPTRGIPVRMTVALVLRDRQPSAVIRP